MLEKIKTFDKKEGQVLQEMSGEIAALEYVLEERDDLF